MRPLLSEVDKGPVVGNRYKRGAWVGRSRFYSLIVSWHGHSIAGECAQSKQLVFPMLDWRRGTIEDLMERQTSNVACAMSVILRSCGSYVQEWFWGRKGHLLPSNVCGPTWSRSSLGSSRPTCCSPHALPLVHGLGRDATHHEVVDRSGWDRRCRHWWMNLTLEFDSLPHVDLKRESRLDRMELS